MIIGATVGLLWIVLLGLATASRADDRHTWTGGPLYLNSTVLGDSQECDIRPDAGEFRNVTVPLMPRRGLHVKGLRLDPWFDGSAEISCTGAVHRTQGQVVRFYPLIEQWYVLFLGLLLIAFGLTRLGLIQQHRPKHWPFGGLR